MFYGYKLLSCWRPIAYALNAHNCVRWGIKHASPWRTVNQSYARLLLTTDVLLLAFCFGTEEKAVSAKLGCETVNVRCACLRPNF